MTFSRETRIGELTGRFPATIKVFQRRSIEYCCGGHRTLDHVCRDKDLPYELLATELEQAISAAPARTTWSDRPLSELTAHIVDAFHDPVRQELPRLQQLSARLHGHDDARKRVLTIVRYELGRFDAELAVQMTAEESTLFPLITTAERRPPTAVERARFVALCREAETFHQDAAYTLRLLRQVTEGYRVPADACASARTLYVGLEEFERLMQLHVHLELNILFARAAALMAGARAEIHR